MSATLLLHHLATASGPTNEVAADAMESYVTARCPSIKYKALLLSTHGGSMPKARRHFEEHKNNPDPLVAALASERVFLCDWIEKQCAPPPKKGSKNQAGPLEVPYEACVWLRYIFKSLSQRLKRSAARSEAATMIIKNWYVDHLSLANAMMSSHVVASAASALTTAPVHITYESSSRSSASDGAPPTKVARKGKGQGKASKSTTPRPSGEQSSSVVVIPESLKHILHPGLTPKEANAAMTEAWHVDKQGSWKVFKSHCRNCWAGGLGFREHSLSECRKLGTACYLECLKCKNGSSHWAEACPLAKK